MKDNRYFRILAVLLFVLSLGHTVTAQSGVTVTTRDNVQLRNAPSRSASSLGVVPFNTTMPASGRSEDSLWVQVNYNGTTGWVAAFLLNWTGNLDTLPVGGLAVSPPAAMPVATGPVSATNVNVINVRAAPNTGSTQLGQLPAGTTIGLNGRWGSGNDMWLRFDFEGRPAWVAGWLLSINGDPNALPDIQAAQNAVVGLCGGGNAPEAAPYNGGPGTHPIVLLNETGGRHPWNNQIGSWGVGSSLGAAELVGCIGEEQRIVIQTCEYFGPSITRYAYQVNVRIIAAQSGQPIANTTLTGTHPRACRSQEPFNLTVLNGSRVSVDQLRDWLQPFVSP